MRPHTWFLIACVVAAMFGTGCAGYQGQIDAQMKSTAQNAANAADAQMRAGVWASCSAPTLGAVRRAFPDAKDIAQYIENCAFSEQHVTPQP